MVKDIQIKRLCLIRNLVSYLQKIKSIFIKPITKLTFIYINIIINVNGVGYYVLISRTTYDALSSSKGKSHQILIYHHITDSSQSLFGFIDNKEKSISYLGNHKNSFISINDYESAVLFINNLELNHQIYSLL